MGIRLRRISIYCVLFVLEMQVFSSLINSHYRQPNCSGVKAVVERDVHGIREYRADARINKKNDDEKKDII